jgi:chromosome segregation ATPase
MESGSKTPLTPKERIDLIRAELESIRASTNQRKWETLNFEMQDLRDELSDEIHVGLKDAANLMGDLGKRLCNLEQKVEELTKAFSKISEASAEAATNTGKGGDR